MNQGGMSMFHDDDEQLGNYCVLQSVSQSVRLWSNSAFEWQISMPSLVLRSVAPPTHISNSDSSA